jgi:hypothetical protein
MKRFTKRTWLLIGIVAIAGVMAAVGAYAYWTTTGTGTGSAAVGTSAGITVNQTSVITGLYPGALPQTLSGNFTNTNPGPAWVNSVSATVTATSNEPACDPADFVIGGSAPVNANVPSGTNVGSWTGLTVSMSNTGSNQNACKNESITISYTSN